MIYELIPNRKPAAALTLACVTSALILTGISLALQGVFADIIKITALALFMGAITVVSRYLSFSYLYCADENEFAVYRKTNRGKIPLCKLYYSEISEIIPFRKGKMRENAARKYDYRMTLGTKNYYLLFFDTPKGREVIYLECNSSFEKYLNQKISPDPLAQYFSENL